MRDRVPCPLSKPPTAQTSLAEVAATPTRMLLPEPGLGLLTMLQEVPFQCSMVVWLLPLLLRLVPTAQTLLSEIAVAPYSVLSKVPTLGIETVLHFPPFTVCWAKFCVP